MTLFSIFIVALVIVILMTIIAAAILFILLYFKVPFVRTPHEVIKKVLTEIKITEDMIVYDLGCGNARFLLEVEKQTGAKTIGFEISPWAYILARLNILLHRSKTKVLYKNFYHQDVSDADVVFCYLLDTVMPKVGTQLEAQLKPGAIVISFAFPIKAWEPTKIITPFTDTKKRSKLYIYQQ